MVTSPTLVKRRKITTVQQAQWVVIVLAGGRSRRMGRDKSSLQFDGQTLLKRAKQAGIEAGYNTRVIRKDIHPGLGPLGGILTAWERYRGDVMLFLSCDMPLVDAKMLKTIAKSFRPSKGALFAEVNGVTGFPFVLNRSTVPVLKRVMDRGKRSLSRLATQTRADRWHPPASWKGRMVNINTPEDWSSLERRHHP